MWVARTVSEQLLALARSHPAIALVGPRQAGKTSLLRRLFPDAKYVPLDDPGVRALALDDPRALLASGEQLILDEVQTAPELLTYVKLEVDRDRRRGRFLLTGSQNLLVNATIAESLAGRAVYSTLLPFDCLEMKRGRADAPYRELASQSAYPEPFLAPEIQKTWLAGYAQSYLERDVRQVASVSDLRDFGRFLRLLALRNGDMLNFADLARDVSVAPNTIKRWISILEASFQVFVLEPHHTQPAKRMIKAPKVYFTDPALAWHLAGGAPRDPGRVLESFVIAAAHRYAGHSGSYRLSYFRNKQGVEVDLLLESTNDRDAPLVAVEIKHTSTFTPALLRGLKYMHAHVENMRAILVSNIAEPPPAGQTTFLCPERFLAALPGGWTRA